MTGIEDDGTSNEYCYDQLRFVVEARLTVALGSVKLDLTGQILSLDEIGWQQPFGIEWLTVRSLTIQLSVTAAAPDFLPEFKIGVGGDIILGDPAAGGKRLAASLAIGATFKPATTPAGFIVVPSFGGVRAYVSSLGMTDLVRLYELVMGESPPPLGDFPLAEVRNAEFMFALEDNAPLCLQQGIAVAGELYLVDELSPPGPVVLPETDDNGCAPFGALVDAEECATTRRDEGCFASFNGQLLPTAILVDGSVGAIDFGPVSFDDARLRIAMLPNDQSFVIKGGVDIGTLATGELAVSLSAKAATFYGRVTMFERFLVQVRAELDLENLSLFDPLPALDFEAVLQADFDSFAEDTLQSMLDGLRSDLAAVEDQWKQVQTAGAAAFADTVNVTFELLGLEPPQWVPGVDTSLTGWFQDATSEIEAFLDELVGLRYSPPSLHALIAGGNGSVSYRGLAVCGFGESYDQSSGICRDGSTPKGVPTVVCFPGFTGSLDSRTNEPRCTLLIPTPGLAGLFPGAPSTLSEGMQELADSLAERMTQLATGVAEFLEDPSLTGLFDTFVRDLAVPGVFSLECASFEFTSDDASPVMATKLKVGVLDEVFGFDHSLNLADPDLLGLFEKLMQGFLSDDARSIQCTEALEPPVGVTDADFVQLTSSVSPTRIVEGSSVTLQGTFSEDPGDGLVTVDWGDDEAASPEVIAVDGTVLSATHRYLDNPEAPASSFTVTVLVDGEPKAVHQVIVTNARPKAGLEPSPSSVDEGGAVSLSIVVTDPGELDSHRADIAWGDGTFTTVADLPSSATVEHVFDDDDPTGTPKDEYTVIVRVTDKDGGTVIKVAPVTVRNVTPVITSALPTAADEAAEIDFDVSWTDPGLDDTHVVRVFWGDGTVTSVKPSRGSRSTHVEHIYADDDPTGTVADPYPIEVRVSDDDLGVVVQSGDVIVSNVEPAVCLSFAAADAAAFALGASCPAAPTLTIDEGPGTVPWHDTGHISVHGAFADPGLSDDHVVVIDWGYDGDGFDPVVLGDPSLVTLPESFPGSSHFPFDADGLAELDDLAAFERGARTFDASRTYGDNGEFTIRAWVIDDDLGVGLAEAVLTVDNLDPEVEIDADLDRADVVLADGPNDDAVLDTPTFLTRAGQSLTAAARAADPGSDDLWFTWSWGDGLSTPSAHLLGDTPDAAPSPEVGPRIGVTDTQAHTWTRPCLYNAEVRVEDDDGGFATDDTWVVVTGTDHRVRNAGWWDTQFDESKKKGKNDLDRQTLQCYVDIARHMSAVFDSQLSTATFADVRAILLQPSQEVGADKLDRQILTTWLNLANGSLDWFRTTATPEGSMPLLDALRRAETVLVSGTREERIAWKDALEATNGR